MSEKVTTVLSKRSCRSPIQSNNKKSILKDTPKSKEVILNRYPKRSAQAVSRYGFNSVAKGMRH